MAEVKETFRKRRAQARLQDVAMEDQEAEPVSTLDSLGRVLEDIESPQVLDQGNPSRHLLEELDGAYQPGDSQGIVTLAKEPKDGDHSRDGTRITPDYEAYALSKVSDFDKRLRLLETAVGMDVVPLPTQDRGPSRAVLPVLDSLDQQVSTISMTEPSLDKISRQIRQMTHESEKLAEARKAAAAQQSSHHSSSERNRLSANRPGGRSTEDKEDLDQTSKINALYGTLSTIESLSPLLPSVLDRLQSLRAIHADAALASEALSKVESRQAAMSDELEEWKKGLERVESAMQAGERSMKENVAVVDGWVSELEKRLQATKLVDST